MLALIAAAALSLAPQAAPPAPRVAATNPADGADACGDLAGRTLSLPDAPTRITEAAWTPAGAGLPAYCRVRAVIEPNVGIELRLPATGWNGKFLEYGRGGYCRAIQMEDCDTPLRKGYACAIYPYPLRAVYRGVGDPNDAHSFTAVAPSAP